MGLGKIGILILGLAGPTAFALAQSSTPPSAHGASKSSGLSPAAPDSAVQEAFCNSANVGDLKALIDSVKAAGLPDGKALAKKYLAAQVDGLPSVLQSSDFQSASFVSVGQTPSLRLKWPDGKSVSMTFISKAAAQVEFFDSTAANAKPNYSCLSGFHDDSAPVPTAAPRHSSLHINAFRCECVFDYLKNGRPTKSTQSVDCPIFAGPSVACRGYLGVSAGEAMTRGMKAITAACGSKTANEPLETEDLSLVSDPVCTLIKK